MIRREFLRSTSTGLASALVGAASSGASFAESAAAGTQDRDATSGGSSFDVRHYGATGDDVYLHQRGGGGADWAALQPPEKANAYPEADMFGVLPATGFFLRHARNVEFSNVEIATEQPDKRAAFWAEDVEDLDVFRVRLAAHSVAYNLNRVRNFRSFGSLSVPDKVLASVDRDTF
jgi:hypothetical protein